MNSIEDFFKKRLKRHKCMIKIIGGQDFNIFKPFNQEMRTEVCFVKTRRATEITIPVMVDSLFVRFLADNEMEITARGDNTILIQKTRGDFGSMGLRKAVLLFFTHNAIDTNCIFQKNKILFDGRISNLFVSLNERAKSLANGAKNIKERSYLLDKLIDDSILIDPNIHINPNKNSPQKALELILEKISDLHEKIEVNEEKNNERLEKIEDYLTRSPR